MRYTPATVTLTMDEWQDVLDDRAELKRLRASDKQYRAMQDDYLKWSLGGGMAEAVFAGMQIEREGRK